MLLLTSGTKVREIGTAAAAGRTLHAPAARVPLAGAPADGACPPRRLASPVLAAYRRWDAVAAVAVLVAGWLGVHLPPGSFPGDVLRLQVSLADVALLLGYLWVWPLIAEVARLYRPGLVPGSREDALRVACAATLAAAVPFGAAFLPLGDSFEPPSAMAFWAGTALVLLAGRALVRMVERRTRRRRTVVIAGSGRRARELVDEVRARPELAIDLAGFVDDPGQGDDFAAATGLPRLGGLADAGRVLMRVEADEVLITLPVASHYAAVQRLVTACEWTGTDSRYFADLFQFSTARPRYERGAVALKSFPDDARRVVKRALDVALSALALVAAAPLMAVIALAIRLDSPGPSLFRPAIVGGRWSTALPKTPRWPWAA